MGLYLKYMMMGLRSQLIYRTSFILMCIGQFFVPFFTFVVPFGVINTIPLNYGVKHYQSTGS